MNIKAIIIDDEPLAIEILKKYSDTIDNLDIIQTFTNPIEAIRFIAENPIDLVFLDIEMPMINGVDLVESLSVKPNIIFTTAFPQYAVEGFNLDAVDYLLKPISYKRFLKAINKIYNGSFQHVEEISDNQPIFINNPENKYIFIKSDYENIKITIQDIKYIEGLKDYLKINLADGKSVLTLSNFNNLLEKINNKDFIRVHNSYVVNLQHIKSIQKNRIIIDNLRIPISETYKKDFFEKIKLQ
ncbi:DNA-binding response regulator [Flavobacterium sp. 9AF]|uniref:LytR/AlgR family response regulator transcription factor n=1 Tax=Flavobacterium sp. 9AF TaxID=2653142 RepID=UPI0012F1554C|nr:LytTR family DNA-binding domain-containing protein [Flavobacterium sp. 9AF]VXB14798.1 DNA-binding response regulator [Flavobacterium sp. 9AF]